MAFTAYTSHNGHNVEQIAEKGDLVQAEHATGTVIEAYPDGSVRIRALNGLKQMILDADTFEVLEAGEVRAARMAAAQEAL